MTEIMVLSGTCTAAIRSSISAFTRSAVFQMVGGIMPELSMIKSDKGTNIPLASESDFRAVREAALRVPDKTVLAWAAPQREELTDSVDGGCNLLHTLLIRVTQAALGSRFRIPSIFKAARAPAKAPGVFSSKTRTETKLLTSFHLEHQPPQVSRTPKVSP